MLNFFGYLRKYNIVLIWIVLVILTIGLLLQVYLIFELKADLNAYRISNDELIHKKLIPALQKMESNINSRLDDIESQTEDFESRISEFE